MLHRCIAVLVTLIWALLLLGTAFTRQSFIPPFVDSDKLLAADWTRRLFIEGLPFGDFQLPRVPSLFPDLAIFSVAQLLTGSWRFAIFAEAVVFLATIAATGGVIAAWLAKQSEWRGMLALMILSTGILVLELLYSGAGRHFIALQPLAHGGSFVATLGCAVLLYLRRSWSNVLLILLVALSVASDRIFVVTFVLPAMVVSYRDWRLVLPIIGAGVAGWLLGSAVYRQADLPITDVSRHLMAFIAGLTPSYLIGTVGPLLFLLGFPAIVRPFGWNLEGRALSLWVFASLSATAPIVLTALFYYEDVGAIRYLSATLWWPLVFAAALLSSLPGKVLIGPAAVAALVPLGVASPTVALWTWRPAVTACLMDWGLQEGLAGYWIARPTEVASDWKLQVDQVAPDGSPMIWGNDAVRYASSRLHLGQVPAYRFVIMEGLDPASIEAKYGETADNRECQGTQVWVYAANLDPAA